jgi:hypothetical protein
MGKWLSGLSAMLVYFCTATVIAQLIGVGMLLTGGNVSTEGFTEILAIAQGVDVFAVKLQGVEQTSQITTEQHSTEQSEHDRAIKLRDLELREQAIGNQMQLVRNQQISLDAERAKYKRLKDVFLNQQNEILNTKKAENLAKEVETIQKMKPKPAKLLLTTMLDHDELDRVVSILSLMAIAERTKIVHEFKTKEDLDLLDMILKRIETGGKEGDAIRSTLESLGGATPNRTP